MVGVSEGYENAFGQAWVDWVEVRDKDGNRLINKHLNLTIEYYKCKHAFMAGWQEGQRCIDANEQD